MTSIECEYNKLQVLLVDKDSKLPRRKSEYAAGYDLFSCENVKIKYHSRELISTGISIALPPNTYGRVAPRSGLSLKCSIDIGAGVIDEDYRGIIGVVFINNSDRDYNIKIGDAIAQLIIEVIQHPEVINVETLSSTKRGSGGYGSTGN